MQNVYEVNPGTGPSTRTLADAGAVEERRRYYATDINLWEFPSRMRTPIDHVLWGRAICDEDAVANTEPKGIRLRATDRESALAQAKAMREGAKPAPAPVAAPKPAPHPATDEAQAWAEKHVKIDEVRRGWIVLYTDTNSFCVEAPSLSCKYASELICDLITSAFRAGVAHERARVLGVLDYYQRQVAYSVGSLYADIRSGRDLREEAK